MKHLNFQALAENEVLKVTGVKHASEVATCLQGFWRNHKGRVPIIFPHQHRRFLRPIRGRQYNKRGYFYFNKPIELRVI